MNEHFLRCQKFKAEIESQITSMHSSKEGIWRGEPQDRNILVFLEVQKRVEADYQQILLKLRQLSEMITQLKDLTPATAEMTARRKAENLVQAYKEIERNARRTYNVKMNQLKEEREKFQLMGNVSTQQDGVHLQIEQRDSLIRSHQAVEESLQIGNDVLLSFERQQNQLKRIQSKVSNIIGDMGFSQGLLKMLGGRQDQDMKIIMLLSFLLLLFICALYYNFKS